ncbi:MAG: endolytic transglycosylase MltG [Pseudomonadota bacterium]
MRSIRRRILFTVLLCLVIVVIGGAYRAALYAPGPLTTEKTVLIEPGMSVVAISEHLKREQVIDASWLLLSYAKLTGQDRRIKAGEYRFPAGISIMQTLHHLEQGRTIFYAVTIPEGLTTQQVVRLLEGDARLTGQATATPEEGSLLPETYFIQRGDTVESLIVRMREAMNEAREKVWQARTADLPLNNPQDLVILASIIERETGVRDERARVAGVFINRLRRGMRLQSDPTVIYGLSEGTGTINRPLLRRDLKHESPYNTYLHRGLPPGAIANPGLASLQAAANPLDTDELYFVADGTGGHVFAKTLEQHNKNVRQWRQVRDRQQ